MAKQLTKQITKYNVIIEYTDKASTVIDSLSADERDEWMNKLYESFNPGLWKGLGNKFIRIVDGNMIINPDKVRRVYTTETVVEELVKKNGN